MSNGRIRSTLPKAIVDETGFHDLEDQYQRTQFRIGCGGDHPELELRFGPGVPDGPATTSPLVFESSGQVQLEFPTFMGHAWRLIDCDIEWDDGTIVTDEEAGITTVTAPIENWESPISLELAILAQSEPQKSTIQRSGDEIQNTVAMLPTKFVRKIGIERGGESRVEPAFGCSGGQNVIVLSRVDEDRGDQTTDRSVVFAGPSNSQPRIAAGEIAVALGVTDILERGDSVPMRWVVQGDELVGFVADDVSSEV